VSQVIGSQALEDYMGDWKIVIAEAERVEVYLHCEVLYTTPVHLQIGPRIQKTLNRPLPLSLSYYLSSMFSLIISNAPPGF
jgi:hypothetical protein